MEHIELGKFGEDAAQDFLIGLGYSFVASNYSKRFGEIDLIFFDSEELVFIEVKTRKRDDDFSGLDAVTPRKLATVRRVGECFMDEFEYECSARIDVVLVVVSGKDVAFEHLVDVL